RGVGNVVHGAGDAARAVEQRGIVRERALRLGHAHGEAVVAEALRVRDLALRLLGIVDAVGAVDARGDGLELLLDRRIERIERGEGGALGLEQPYPTAAEDL